MFDKSSYRGRQSSKGRGGGNTLVNSSQRERGGGGDVNCNKDSNVTDQSYQSWRKTRRNSEEEEVRTIFDSNCEEEEGGESRRGGGGSLSRRMNQGETRKDAKRRMRIKKKRRMEDYYPVMSTPSLEVIEEDDEDSGEEPRRRKSRKNPNVEERSHRKMDLSKTKRKSLKQLLEEVNIEDVERENEFEFFNTEELMDDIKDEIVIDEEKRQTYPCNECPVKVGSKEQLELHMNIYHNCPVCNVKAKNREEMNNHIKSDHKMEELDRTKDRLANEMDKIDSLILTENNIKTCQECEIVFEDEEKFKNHMKQHDEDNKVYEEDLRRKTAKSGKDDKGKDEATENNTKKGREVKDKNNQKEKVECNKETSRKCKMCKHEAKDEPALMKHMETEHVNVDKIPRKQNLTKCNDCDQIYDETDEINCPLCKTVQELNLIEGVAITKKKENKDNKLNEEDNKKDESDMKKKKIVKTVIKDEEEEELYRLDTIELTNCSIETKEWWSLNDTSISGAWYKGKEPETKEAFNKLIELIADDSKEEVIDNERMRVSRREWWKKKGILKAEIEFIKKEVGKGRVKIDIRIPKARNKEASVNIGRVKGSNEDAVNVVKEKLNIIIKEFAQDKTVDDINKKFREIEEEKAEQMRILEDIKRTTKKCKVCEKACKNERGLKLHMLKMHQYSCKKCNFKCEEEKTMKSHMDNKHIRVKCDKCNHQLVNKEQLYLHMKMKHNEEVAKAVKEDDKKQFNRFIKELPKVLKDKRGGNEKLLRVPEDGQCVFHGISAKVFGDNIYANLLRKKVCQYIADQDEKYLAMITCVPNDKDKLKNMKKHMNDPDGHIKHWADHVDIKACADYLKVSIVVEKIDNIEDPESVVNSFVVGPEDGEDDNPDEDKTDLDPIHLLMDENAAHYYLILQEDDPILEGTVSEMLKNNYIKKKVKNEDKPGQKETLKVINKKAEEMFSKVAKNKVDEQNRDLRKELSEDAEILRKTEEEKAEDDHKISTKKSKKEEETQVESSEEDEDESSSDEDDEEEKCKECNKTCKNRGELNEHILREHKRQCQRCNKKSLSKQALNIHMKTIHKEDVMDYEEDEGMKSSESSDEEEDDESLYRVKCNFCRQSMENRDELHRHKMIKHKVDKLCKFFAKGSCQFDEENCRFSHTAKEDEMVTCRLCKKVCLDMTNLKVHRKDKHEANVMICNEYQLDRCNFGDTCYYVHKTEEERKQGLPYCPFKKSCNFIDNPVACKYRHKESKSKSVKTQVFQSKKIKLAKH